MRSDADDHVPCPSGGELQIGDYMHEISNLHVGQGIQRRAMERK